MTRDVLAWIMLVLTVWLAIGVLTARLFGALVTDEDDQELTKGSRALIEPDGLSVGPLISDLPDEASTLSSQEIETRARLKSQRPTSHHKHRRTLPFAQLG